MLRAMLTTLRISGFAVVDQVEVRFGPGLGVLTGETGAGKSILVNALHLALGGRMSAEVLREGAEEAVVEALFELPPGHPVLGRLEAAGVPRPEPSEAGTVELLVRRVAPRGGRGRAFVNGSLCTVSMLESALKGLVDISGQHEHVSLLDPGTHLDLIDAFAGEGPLVAGSLPARYRDAFAAFSALWREDRALDQDEGERARRADYLAFQLKEMEAAEAKPGEDQALEQERKVLLSAARLADAARAAEGLAYGEEGSAAERVGQAVRALSEAAQLDPRLAPTLELLRSAAAEVAEAGRELGRYAGSVGGDPERLAFVEERLALLKNLARKHGGSLAAALERAAAMAAELSSLEGTDGRRAELGRLLAERGAEAARLAAELTRARQGAAREFARAVRRELEGLAMERCRLEVAFGAPEGALAVGEAALGAAGAERAEILLAPNPGEPARALAKIASGGELSRVLLAVKRALSAADPVLTQVFDEVDAGIGGAVAEAVGRVLAEVSRERQVLCVTHLPQVAAFADRHYLVEKRVAAGRTSTSVRPLDDDAARRGEVARMLAGQTVTASALEHADALLAAARSPAAGSRREGGRRAAARREGARA
ncbi:MAG TPA: DNA repair protein RecN [Anaeromyxobacteraceae bacterium]|nr:DNA repair protein RecN [Anaeromyxobacteraceae bacterium]